MNVAYRSIIALLIAGITIPAHAERMSIEAALRALQAQGHTVVFSSDVVALDTQLEIETISPAAISDALAPHGLTLRRTGDFWAVVERPATHAIPRSSADAGREGPRELETVIVTGTRHRLPEAPSGVSSTTLSGQELHATPTLGGDSIRVVNQLPGMSSVGLSASPLVRGGAEDETLIRIDGVELIEPFHLADFQSIFSTIDDRTVESIDFYSGGFPARYGNRMSGVMDIVTHQAPHPRATEIGLTTYTAFANTRGRNEDDSSWWLASLRRGDLEPLTDRIDSRTGSPRYWDAYGSVGHRLSRATNFTVGGLYSHDDIEFRDGAETASSDVDNRYAWLRVEHQHTDAIRSTSVISLAEANRRKRQSSPADDEDSAGFLDYERDLARISARSDWSVEADATLIEMGVALDLARASYDAVGLVDRGILGELLGRPAQESIDIHRRIDGPSFGAYAAADFRLGERVSIQPGLRYDAQGYDPDRTTHHVSPRLGMEWQATPAITAALAVGRFFQPEAIFELQVTDGIDRFASPQRADHYIASLRWKPTSTVALRAEAYYKDYGSPKLRFENVFTPFVILPEIEPDRVPIAPSAARVRGFDFEMRYDPSDRISSILRYSHLDAEDRINGRWVPRRWSQRDTVHGIAIFTGDVFEISAALTWHTGWHTSEPPDFSTGPLAIEDVLNQRELARYFSVDVRIARTWRLARSAITLHADLSNVLDRKNQAGIDYDVSAVPGGYTFQPDRETLLPYLPSVGILIRF